MAVDIYSVYNNTAEKTNRPEYNLQDFAIWKDPQHALGSATGIIALAERVARGEANPDEQAVYQALQEQTSGIQARPIESLRTDIPWNGEGEDPNFHHFSEDFAPIMMQLGEKRGRGELSASEQDLINQVTNNWDQNVEASQRDDSFKGVMANLFGNSFTFPALFAAGAMGANLIGGLAGAGLGAGAADVGGSIAPIAATPELAAPVAGAGAGTGAGIAGAGAAGAAGTGGAMSTIADWAPLLGPAISTGGSLIGGVIAGGAASDAARQQQDAARESNALLAAIYAQQRADMEPWRQAGQQALGPLQALAGNMPQFDPYQAGQAIDPNAYAFNGSQYDFVAPNTPVSADQYRFDPNQYAFNTDQYAFNTDQYAFKPPTGQELLSQDPGYQFRLEQGRKALEASAANRGGLLSGGTLTGLEKFAQGLASQEYGNAYDRALGQNQMAYQRGLTGNELAYGRGLTGNQMSYERGLTGNELGWNRANQENENVYSRALAQNDQQYNRALQGNQLSYERGLQANQDAAARQYQQYMTNLNTQLGLRGQQFNELAALSGVGQTAGANLAQAAGNYGQQASNNIQGAANAGAAGRIGAANALTGALSGAGNAAQSYLQYAALRGAGNSALYDRAVVGGNMYMG
jgi:hypothetical protein